MKMWIETSNEVYAVIFAKHRKQLKLHSSFTDSTGDGYHFSSGKPEIMTEWGFEKAETPLLKIVQTKENEEQKDWDVGFFIYCSETKTSLNHDTPPMAKPLLGARVSFVSTVLIYKPTMTGKVVFESENYVKILPDDRRIGYATRKKNEVERI